MARQGIESASLARSLALIAGHPLFPATIALWFAALFGLGSMAIRQAAMESLLSEGGLDYAISGVALPLGLADRAVVSLALAIAGGVLGLAVARLLCAATQCRRESQAHMQVRRPFSASEIAKEPQAKFKLSGNITIDNVAALGTCEPSELAPAIGQPTIDPPAIDVASLRLAHHADSFPPAPVPEPGLEGPTIAPIGSNEASPARLGKAAQRILAAELSTLTPIELVERLGISMLLQQTSVPPGTELAPRRRPGMPDIRLQSAPRARADPEQVLRSALAALQRLSGTAYRG